jgi:hypothetical protein
VNAFASNLIDTIFNETVEDFLNAPKIDSIVIHEENISRMNLPKFDSSMSVNVSCSDSIGAFQNNLRSFRRHSTDVGFFYDEINDDNCNLNTDIENNNTQFFTNRRHSLHSMDYRRKLNDLAKQFKKQNKNKLETKRIIVNKSNSSSIGIGLNLNSANSSHKSSNESLNKKTTVNQYAKLTLKSILQKTDSKKKIEKKNLRNENKFENYLKNCNYVNKLVSDIFDESFDQIRSEYKYNYKNIYLKTLNIY